MSDLLPLLCASLKERVLLEAQEELKQLQDLTDQVQIIHRNHETVVNDEDEDEEEDSLPIVYAAGSIRSNGKYSGNLKHWEVTLSMRQTCRLVDLKHCGIYVGAGFVLNHLFWTNAYRAFFDVDDQDTQDCKVMNVCFGPNPTMWLQVIIKGWSEWQEDRERHPFFFDDGDSDELLEFLCDDVASRFPDARVEFRNVDFDRSSIQPAIRRLIPRHEIIKARKERDNPMEDDSEDEEEIPPVVDYAMSRFAHHQRDQNFPENRTIRDFLETIFPILPRLDMGPGDDVTFLNHPQKVALDRLVICYLAHGRDISQWTIDLNMTDA